MTPLLSLVISFLLLSSTCFSQHVLTGKVTDSKTGAGIPFVNIVINRTQSGTSSDMEGGFSIKVQSHERHDSLLFSAIGYQTLRKSIADIQENALTTFALKDTVYQLAALVFEDTVKSAVTIMRKAMANVKLNYDQGPHKLEAIFRIVDKENGNYVRMLEAAVNIYDADFMNKNSREVDYLAIRQTNDYRTFKWRMNKSNVRGVEDLLQPDLIKRPTRATHENGFTTGFTYELDDMKYLDGEELYVIHVTRRPEAPWANYNGTFYVRAKDLAILRVERTYTIPRDNWVDSAGITTRITKDKLTLIYRERLGKLYLNYFAWQLRGEAFNKKTNTVTLDFERWEELSVHNITNDQKPKKIRKAWSKDIYQMVDPYDETFWNNYPTVNTELFDDVKKELSKKEKLEKQFKAGN